jgi:hypothetical protein
VGHKVVKAAQEGGLSSKQSKLMSGSFPSPWRLFREGLVFNCTALAHELISLCNVRLGAGQRGHSSHYVKGAMCTFMSKAPSNDFAKKKGGIKARTLGNQLPIP